VASVRILGPIEVWAGGRRLDLGGPRQVALLAVLVLHAGRAVPSDLIIDVLWGERRSGSSKRLQMAVSRLRRALEPLEGEPRLRTVGGGYLLSVAPGELDAEVFQTAVRDGRTALADGEPAVASKRLNDALALWRGPPLADVAFDEFAQANIRGLLELRLVALEARIEADLALRRDGELIGELQVLVAQEPSRERLAGQLMVALYRSGRQADALEVYQRIRAHLAEELGLEPGPALRSLQVQILAHGQELDAGVAPSLANPSADSQATPARGNLPPEPVGLSQIPLPPTATIGRDEEIAAVIHLLREPGVRLVTLTGPGGVGKTRLALAVAHAVEADVPDGARWVELAAVARSEDVAFTMAQELGISAVPGETIEAALRRFLAVRRLLLVIDNFEQVVDAGPLIAELLASCAGLVVLVTSRDALRLRAEHRFVVAPLAVPSRPEEATPEEIAATQATALFVAAAKRQDNRFRVTQSAAPVIARICSQLDGLPLALELAAARTGLLSVEDLEARLRRTFAELGAGPRDVPARQRTLDATIEWSYNLLGDQSQAALLRFAVFAGGATAEAAEAVTGARAETWEALIAKSLLDARRQPGGETRLMMLESVRQYVNEHLTDPVTRDAVRRSHCRYYLEVAEQAAQGFSGPHELASVEMLDREIHNLRAASAWALQEEPLLALRLTGHLEYYWWIRDDPDALSWLNDAVAAAGDHPPPQDLALAHLGRSMELTRHGQPPDFQAATQAAEAALGLYRRAGDHAGTAEAFISLTRLARLSGSHDSGRALAEEACRYARLAGDGVLVGKALGRLALCVPEPERAPMVSEAGELLKMGGHRRELANVYCNAGYSAVVEGDAEEAISLLEQALAAAESIDYPYLKMLAHGNLGLARLLKRHFELARRHFIHELRLCAGIDVFRVMVGEGLTGLAAIHVANGRLADAARLHAAGRMLGFPEPSDRGISDWLEAEYFGPGRAEHGDQAWSEAERAGEALSYTAALSFAIDDLSVTNPGATAEAGRQVTL
jgi:predicted ATPase/DNA-binding SARP family transcriptional activator